MDSTGTLFLPPGESTLAGQVDSLFNFILYAGFVLFLIVAVGVIVLVWRYRRRPGEEIGRTSGVSHNIKLEILWSVIPTILVIIVFFWGFNIYLKMNVVPADAYEIKVTAQKWFWSFAYPNGASTVGELVVPEDRPIKLLMSSQDVIHSLYIPDFRLKMDVLPNRYTITWFEAEDVGEYNLFCAEYCGTSHSDMLGRVKVLGEREFNQWLEQGATEGEGVSLEDYGEQLFKGKACQTCHNITRVAQTGPGLGGVFGSAQKMADGSTVTADENYIRESILKPQAKVVAGFQPVMPTFQGILSQKQIDALTAYIKSLKDNK